MRTIRHGVPAPRALMVFFTLCAALAGCEAKDPQRARREDIAAVRSELRVNAITPERGVITGGTVVVIDGQDFVAGNVNVTFGGVQAARITVLSATQLEAVSPPHAAGRVDVVVSDATSTVRRYGAFEYSQRVTPRSGPENGGTWLTILSDTRMFDNETTVLFDGSAGSAVVYVNPYVLRVMSPPHAPGTVDLLVRAGITNFAIPQGFTYDSSVGQAGAPRVVSAVSKDNTHVLVSFSEAMRRELVNDPGNYSIVPLYQNSEAGGVKVVSAAALPGDTSVLLTTRPQNQVTYQLTVTNVRDADGNVLAAPELLVNPSVAVFAGVGEAGVSPTDSDSDGLSDADEQLGWTVSVTLLNGTVIERQVASDPDNPDTDQDSMLDGDERAAGMDPTRPDTDSDTLGDFAEWNRYLSDPANQDTDGDTLNDPTELFFLTSIVLADTDGDQFSDSEEIIVRQRNPRVADLPQPVLEVGNVGLALDLRYAYTDTSGVARTLEQSVNTTLQTENASQTTTYGQWTQAFEVGGEFSAGVEFSADPSITFGLKAFGKYGKQWTGGTDNVSATNSINALNQAVTQASVLETTSSVARTTEGASVSVSAYFSAGSNVAFTLKNVQLTLLHGDADDRSQLVPVATLLPAADNLEINLGPGVPSQGPIIFRSTDVFPSQVEELMRNPEAMVVRFANYDVVSEDGRNLAFISQEVEERTGTVVLDFGNGSTEEYRIALSNEWDPRTGKPLGLRFTDALRAVGIENGPCGGAPAGGVECQVDADCVAAAGPGADPAVDPVVCNRDGAIGVCVATDWCDDVLVVDNLTDRYRERLSADHDVTRTFGLRVQRDATGAPVFDASGAPVMDLARIRGVQADLDFTPVTVPPLTGRNWSGIARPEYQRRWVLLSDGEASESFANLSFAPGKSYLLAFTVDQDGDGLYKIEERAFGTSDTTLDFDGDRLSDWEEVRGGRGPRVATADGTRFIPSTPFNVTTDNYSAYRVYPHPNAADSDGDGLDDLTETNIGTDPTKIDTDEDGRSDAVEIAGWSYTNGVGEQKGPFSTDPIDSDSDGDRLIDGVEALWDTDPLVDDVAQVADSDRDGLPDARDKNCVTPSSPTPADDNDSDNDGLSDFIEWKLGTELCEKDSDGDGIADLNDWDGLLDPAAEDHCRASLNCFLPERKAGTQLGTKPTDADTDDDGISDGDERTGWLVTLRSSSPTAQDPRTRQVTSNPLLADTDGDGVMDGSERSARIDPRSADTDRDGSTDLAELSAPAIVGTDIPQAHTRRDPLRPDRRLQVRLAWMQIYVHPDGDQDEYLFHSDLVFPSGESVWLFDVDDMYNMMQPPLRSEYAQLCDTTGPGNDWKFAPGRADRLWFTAQAWNTETFVLATDESVFIDGWLEETNDTCSAYTSQWLWGGPAVSDAVIKGNVEDDTYRVFRTTGSSVKGTNTNMDFELAVHIRVLPDH